MTLDSKVSNVKDEATKKLHECVSKVKISQEVRTEYMMWEEKIFYEKLDAKEEGRAEGRVEGNVEERIRIVKNMLDKNKTFEEIANLLDISVDEVKRLVNEVS